MVAHISAVCDDDGTMVSVNGPVDHLRNALCSVFQSVLENETLTETDLHYLVIMAANLANSPE